MANEQTPAVLDGNAAFKREDSITFIDINFTVDPVTGVSYADGHTPQWFAVGEDNDELTRERNDESDSSKNVLGETNISVTPGAQTTEVDPKKIRGNESLSYLLYMMNKYDLTGDQAKLTGMEVFYGDKQSEGVYGAWTESLILQVNSWGGDTTATQAPFVLNWKGDKTHGTFSTSTKQFTPTTQG